MCESEVPQPMGDHPPVTSQAIKPVVAPHETTTPYQMNENWKPDDPSCSIEITHDDTEELNPPDQATENTFCNNPPDLAEENTSSYSSQPSSPGKKKAKRKHPASTISVAELMMLSFEEGVTNIDGLSKDSSSKVATQMRKQLYENKDGKRGANLIIPDDWPKEVYFGHVNNPKKGSKHKPTIEEVKGMCRELYRRAKKKSIKESEEPPKKKLKNDLKEDQRKVVLDFVQKKDIKNKKDLHQLGKEELCSLSSKLVHFSFTCNGKDFKKKGKYKSRPAGWPPKTFWGDPNNNIPGISPARNPTKGELQKMCWELLRVCRQYIPELESTSQIEFQASDTVALDKEDVTCQDVEQHTKTPLQTIDKLVAFERLHLKCREEEKAKANQRLVPVSDDGKSGSPDIMSLPFPQNEDLEDLSEYLENHQPSVNFDADSFSENEDSLIATDE